MIFSLLQLSKKYIKSTYSLCISVLWMVFNRNNLIFLQTDGFCWSLKFGTIKCGTPIIKKKITYNQLIIFDFLRMTEMTESEEDDYDGIISLNQSWFSGSYIYARIYGVIYYIFIYLFK